MGIKLFKFVSGEEIIANVVSEENGNFIIDDVTALVYRHQENGQMTVGFGPFMPYANGKITLYGTQVLSSSDAADDLKSEFNRIFGAGIVVAQANDSLFRSDAK